MNIKPVSNNITPAVEGTRIKSKVVSDEKKDQLQISDKAIEMNKTLGSNPKLEELQEKIKNKFYDSDEIIRSISVSILKELEQEK